MVVRVNKERRKTNKGVITMGDGEGLGFARGLLVPFLLLFYFGA